MPEFNDCTSIHTDQAIRLPDCGKVLVLKNPARRKVSRIRFDGCVLKNATAADYVIGIELGLDLIVELKGKNVEHAIDQIENSATHLKHVKSNISPKLGVIYCKQVPAGSSSINKKRESLFKKHGIRLKISSSKSSYCVEKNCFE